MTLSLSLSLSAHRVGQVKRPNCLAIFARRDPRRPDVPPCAERDQLLATDSYEALHVVRRGDWVLKFLRPHDAFAGQTAADRLRQLRLRVQESRRHAELNPLWFDEPLNCLISRFVPGPCLGTRGCSALLASLMASRRGFIADVTPENVVSTSEGPLIVDFGIEETHPDWHFWKS